MGSVCVDKFELLLWPRNSKVNTLLKSKFEMKRFSITNSTKN